ncbi:MAG TPA: hypothetical protein PK514_06270 [Spirochaetota bacterium]|nr:hypothetical protein [Spirochaetota bacterium]
MLREIIIPREREYILKIPGEYINKTIEILVLPIDSESLSEPLNKDVDIIKKTSGILKNRSIDPVVWQRDMRSEWEGRS